MNYNIKIKFLLDSSKEITYLHSNGILHHTNIKVNSKLPDFGSSRNINMLMTNMTFTNGIGTPVHMAPEILDRQKYKKSADIYSFAITIHVPIIWNEVYPIIDKFKYTWHIAEFITNGNRLPKPDIMNDSIYSLVTNCWKQEPKKRYSIE
ncbi:Serine/threonine protein kinase HT1 [Entamoeba marina]